MDTPTTEAGRALYDDVRIHNIAQRRKADDKHDKRWLRRILAIEAEAAVLACDHNGPHAVELVPA